MMSSISSVHRRRLPSSPRVSTKRLGRRPAAGPQTTAEHAEVALYPRPKELPWTSRDGASSKPRAPERRGEPGRDTWP
ncbi:MAG: hypothetical protein ACK55Z_32050 [bacterium]